MKLKQISKILLIILSFVLFPLAQDCFGHDTDLYMSSGEGVEPNILIMFDSSGSMGDLVPAPAYVPATDYADVLATSDPPITPEVPSANRNVVYSCTTSGSCNTVFKNDISQVLCTKAKTSLTNSGYFVGTGNSSVYSDSTCCTSTKNKCAIYTLRTGNYRNYLKYKNTNPTFHKTKIQVAKDVIKEFIDNVEGVRLGVMKFNNNEGGKIQSAIVSLDDSSKTTVKDNIDDISASGYTPLAETLYEAGLYLKGGASYFNSPQTYISPIEYGCQRNYVVIITDGDSTKDRNSVLRNGATGFPAIGDQDGDGFEPGYAHAKTYYDCSSCNPSCSYPNCPSGCISPNCTNSCCNNLDGSDYLDDVAMYLYQTDLRSDFTGTQNAITYTIGFTVNSQWQLLERTAQHGHGKYYFCEDAQGLAESFQNVIADILAKSSSFVAPIVPVSQMEKSTAGDKMYLALFKPQRDGMWKGNIKKFGIAQPMGVTSDCPYNPAFEVGEVIDATCKKALDPYGQFYSTAKSYWVTINNDNDGGEVENGGVGEVLMDRDFGIEPRKIYTYLQSNVNLVNSSNEFKAANITPEMLGLTSGDTDGRNKVINYVYGYDAYGQIPSQKRDWILGAFLHSRPFIVSYNSSTSVIYAGSNDGMLHAFDASNGKELWAFIPPSLLQKLQALHLDVNEIFVDGSPKAYLKRDSDGNIGGDGTEAILIFGLRRGGDRYIALNVKDPANPKFLWEIGPSAIVYGTTETNTETYIELRQSWSNPKIGNIENGTKDGKPVIFIGGGYDEQQDNDVPPADDKGRAVYVIDALTGALIKRFSNAEHPSTMTYSIPSDVSPVDTDGDGKIDRLYVGDMGGRMWRFNIKGSNPGSWSGKIIFQSNPGRDASTGRKIFYPPDVTLETEVITVDGNPTNRDYEMLYFGTGDREHPKNTTIVDRLYAIKDRDPTTPLTESADQLVDVTEDLLQEPGTPLDTLKSIREQLKQLNGWFIKLNQNDGEKSLSSPVIFYGIVYYTTFTPTSETSNPEDDPCYVGEGKGRLYVVEYNTGNAIFDFDPSNNVTALDPELSKQRLYNLRRNDRIDDGGGKITGILSDPIITFIQGTAVGYTGVSAGIKPVTLITPKSLVPIYWFLKGGQL